MVKFHQTWFKPNNATLVVVGDTTMAEIKPEARAALRRAGSRGGAGEERAPPSPRKAKPAVYLIDRPGAQQSLILAGHVAPPKANPDEIAIEAMNASSAASSSRGST